MINQIYFKMKKNYQWTNLFMVILACLALITLGLHIYANWKISAPSIHFAVSHEAVLAVIRVIWISSIPIFLFFMLTAIAGFWRQRFYLPLFFIFFFWLGGWREFQEIGYVFQGYLQFGISLEILAWSFISMLIVAMAATISWIVEYFCQKKKTGK